MRHEVLGGEIQGTEGARRVETTGKQTDQGRRETTLSIHLYICQCVCCVLCVGEKWGGRTERRQRRTTSLRYSVGTTGCCSFTCNNSFSTILALFDDISNLINLLTHGRPLPYSPHGRPLPLHTGDHAPLHTGDLPSHTGNHCPTGHTAFHDVLLEQTMEGKAQVLCQCWRISRTISCWRRH